MTELPPPSNPDPRPATLRATEFSWLAFMAGLVFSLAAGLVLNLVSGILGMATGVPLLALLVGAIPGVIFALIGSYQRITSPGLGTGLLVGGCIVALIGGACGAATLGTRFQ